MVAIPLYIRHHFSWGGKPGGGGNRMELTVGPKQSMGKVLEEVVLEMQLPRAVQNCALLASQGKYQVLPFFIFQFFKN
jgi:AP-3 complex subunit mu